MELEKKARPKEPAPDTAPAEAPETEKPTKKEKKKKSLRGLDADPDLLKKTIAEVLSEEGNPAPKNLAKIAEDLDCSQPTVRKWIKKLETSGLVEAKMVAKGRGRPKAIYHPTSELLSVIGAEVTTVPEPPEEPKPPTEEPAPEVPTAPEVPAEETPTLEEAPAKVEEPPAEEPAPETEAPTPTEPEAPELEPPEEMPEEAPVEAPITEPEKPEEAQEQVSEPQVPKEPTTDIVGGEDTLLSELAGKLGTETEPAAPEVEPSPETAEPREGEVSAEGAPLEAAEAAPEAAPEGEAPEAVPTEAPQPEAVAQPTTVESIGDFITETDAAIEELAEKVATADKTRAPQEFYDYCTFEVPAGYQELERYWIMKPFAWAAILYSPERNERVYHMVEPSLTPGEKTALELLHEHLLDRLSYDSRVKDRDRILTSKVGELLREYGIAVGARSIRKLLYYLKRNYIGYGRIDSLLHDPNIEDISCDGLNVSIFIYSRRYQSLRTNLIFTDANELDLFVIRLVERAGKQISLGKPTIDASMPEGYRLQATLGTEVTTRGSSFSIRKYAEEPFTPIDLLSYGTYSVEMLAYLWLGTENKKNIVIVGGTASGKTSTLNALSMFIWPDAKIVSIEDTRELALYQENWVPSVTRPAPGERGIEMYDLLRQALRQRPEVIIVGEVRGKEALTMFQAMTTGHTCYSTMHAGSIQEMVHRLEGEPINVPHHMLSSLDIVCLQLLTYFRDQRVRRNQTIIEVAGIDPATGSLRTNRIFERNPLTDEFERVGESQVLREIAKERGWSALDLERELRQRREVLQYLVKSNIRRLNEVAAVTRQYFFEPEKVIEQLTAGKLKI